ncbi:hypothetical protein [Streptomyces sp. WMMC940]|uniref:hypothetical protein n=1 Tax=Streptomyces sp. WMMC940 TaxID=3015153 RepID=UPI0022B72890|nr:hypothetical protein [Streptomyces sp. WMMC940]MCZ7462154.1 hypothetical protein [Streptomyces sp. WMMC940]
MARSVRGGGILAVLASLLVLLIPGTAAAADPHVRYTSWLTNAAVHGMRASYSWQCLDVRGDAEPYPSLWTPVHDRQYDSTGVRG